MEDDEREGLESIAKQGQMLHTTINTNGWKEVIKPALVDRQVALVEEFLSAKTYEEFVRIQQAINGIKSVLSFVEVTLMEGKSALGELKENP